MQTTQPWKWQNKSRNICQKSSKIYNHLKWDKVGQTLELSLEKINVSKLVFLSWTVKCAGNYDGWTHTQKHTRPHPHTHSFVQLELHKKLASLFSLYGKIGHNFTASVLQQEVGFKFLHVCFKKKKNFFRKEWLKNGGVSKTLLHMKRPTN